MPRKKKPRGRPPKYPMPEPLDTDMDTLAEVVLKAKPKEVWRFSSLRYITPRRKARLASDFGTQTGNSPNFPTVTSSWARAHPTS